MVVEILPHNMDDRRIAEVVQVLRNGGVIIFPTDTVYSFGCALDQPRAIERMARLRGLKPSKANFSIVCNDLAHITDYSKPMNNTVFKLMKGLLPGPYTFILEANRNIPSFFSANRKTIGIRVPDNTIAQVLVRELGVPLVSSSVHDDDEILEYTTDPGALHERWENDVDLVVDGGPGGLEASTILDCTGKEIVLVRQGKGSVEDILRD